MIVLLFLLTFGSFPQMDFYSTSIHLITLHVEASQNPAKAVESELK